MKSYVPTQTALCWRPVTLDDKASYSAILQKTALRSADRAFANLYIWNEIYRQDIAFTHDFVLIRFKENNDYQYLAPLGKGDILPIINALREEPGPLCLVAVTEDEANCLLAACPDTFALTETRDCADYLYDAATLATLSGKKLHAKRNHINAFSAANDWEIAPLTPKHFDSCREIMQRWSEAQTDTSAEYERRAMERAFAAYSELELEGAILTVGAKAVAFTIASMINRDTLDVHFEKALPAYFGAYPVINREFVRMMQKKHPALAFVNREDDMGLENLRRAKLSYRPAILLKKFTLTQSPH